MIYRHRRPPPPLSDFVADLWLYSGYQPPHAFERILPSGTVELVINLNASPLRCYDPATLAVRAKVDGPLLSGVRAEFAVVDTRQQRDLAGVHFRPGGAFAFLGAPVSEVENADLPLELFWGADAHRLHEELARARTYEGRFGALEAALRRRLLPGARLHPVIRGALARLDAPDPAVKVGGLAADANWSSRHFIRTFRAQVGIAPKAYARIRRFQRALRAVRAGAGGAPDWAGLALDCGYYDQAHFIRDFRAFTGLTPTGYARLAASAFAHVPMPERGQVCPAV